MIFSVVLVWSGINPKDQFTWFLEVAPLFDGLFGFVRCNILSTLVIDAAQ